MDRAENVSSIIACPLAAGKTCPQSYSLTMAVVLLHVYTAVNWQWVYMSQYLNIKACGCCMAEKRTRHFKDTVGMQ
jgi:hypothetical protein